MFLLQFFKNTITPIEIILLMSTCVITVVKYNFYHVYNIKFSIKISQVKKQTQIIVQFLQVAVLECVLGIVYSSLS